MSISSIVTRGFGVWGSISGIVRRGFGTAVPVSADRVMLLFSSMSQPSMGTVVLSRAKMINIVLLD